LHISLSALLLQDPRPRSYNQTTPSEFYMSIEQIIVIAIIQGLTEFLPVSSSGHLALIPVMTDWPSGEMC